MRSGTLSITTFLSSLLLITAQYYADNQYYFYNQQFQQQYWPQRTIVHYPQQSVRYPPQQNYVPRPAPPQAIVPPLQRQQRGQSVPEKKTVVNHKVVEFDLPPIPPQRFLPDEERAKVLTLSKQGRPEHIGIVSTRQHRIRLINSVTNNTSNQIQPQVQIHHLQIPRVLQKASTVVPSQITHTTSSLAPPPPVFLTSTFQFSTTTSAPLIVSTVNEHFVEVETITKPVSHLSTARVGGKKINPNKIFLQCCLDKKVAKVCEAKCNFDNINKKSITAMFIGTDPCPQRYGLDLFGCAAQENDHRTCCRSKNVQRTSAGEKCLSFCNLRPETHFQADASYLPCWSVLNDVKNCFKEAIINGGPM